MKNKPRIRFKGFAEDWEQRELAELCNVYDGTHQTPRYTNSGVMFVSVENIKTLESDKYISEDDFKNEFKIFPEFGDILLTRIGDVGSANIILDNIKRAYYVSLALLKPKGVNSLFLLALLSSASVQSEIWKRTLHIAFPKKINKNEISKVIVSKPSILEQKKIGELIYALDQIITLHQRKLEKLKLAKKALLQKLFPKNGSKFPELRFNGFADAWEQRELSSLTEYIGTGKSRFAIKEFGEYAILGSTNVIGYDDAYDYDGNFILTARVGANAGQLYQYSGKVKITDNTVFLMSDRSQFIYYALTHFDLRRLSFGTGQPLVKSSELQKLKLCVPVSKSEQEKIGEIFNNIDNIITLHQRKLDKLQEVKKGLLQKMFV